MAIDSKVDKDRNPNVHKGLNSVFVFMGEELDALNSLRAETRKYKLFKLSIKDFLQEDKELREVGLAYVNNF